MASVAPYHDRVLPVPMPFRRDIGDYMIFAAPIIGRAVELTVTGLND